MSNVMLEWDKQELAFQYAQEGIAICKQWAQADALADGYLQLAKIYQSLGKQAEATDAMRKAERVAKGYSSQIGAYMSAQLTKLYLRQRNKALVSDWLVRSRLNVHDELEISSVFIYLVLARVLIFQGDLDKALHLLTRLETLVEKIGKSIYEAEILILQAMVWKAKGDEDKAVDRIKLALTITKPEGFVRIFVDEGGPMKSLLRQVVTEGVEVDFVRTLLSSIEADTKHKDSGVDLIEPLTEREMEVLNMLTTPLTHARIAEELFISQNTVRTHVKRIYTKLQVKNRLQAINRARELRLL